MTGYDEDNRFFGGLAGLGKTVPSYRMALEFEIRRWKSFRNALPNEEARVAFDELMDMCRDNGMASGEACNPILFELIVMSILLAQQKKLRELEHKLNDVLLQKISTQPHRRVKANNKVHATTETK